MLVQVSKPYILLKTLLVSGTSYDLHQVDFYANRSSRHPRTLYPPPAGRQDRRTHLIKSYSLVKFRPVHELLFALLRYKQ